MYGVAPRQASRKDRADSRSIDRHAAPTVGRPTDAAAGSNDREDDRHTSHKRTSSIHTCILLISLITNKYTLT